MHQIPRQRSRPEPSACFVWDDAETGDRLRVSIRLSGDDHGDFFADLEATGFRRIGEAEKVEDPSRRDEMPEAHARRSDQAETKDGEDGGTLPCSIDVISAFHAAEHEHPLADRPATDDDPGTVRRESA